MEVSDAKVLARPRSRAIPEAMPLGEVGLVEEKAGCDAERFAERSD